MSDKQSITPDISSSKVSSRSKTPRSKTPRSKTPRSKTSRSKTSRSKTSRSKSRIKTKRKIRSKKRTYKPKKSSKLTKPPKTPYSKDLTISSKIVLPKDDRIKILEFIKGKPNSINCAYETALFWLDDGNVEEGAKYLGSGSSGVVFKGCPTEKCDNKVAVKMVTWDTELYANLHMTKKRLNISKPQYSRKLYHPVDVERIFLEKFNNLYFNNISPHVTLFYNSIECKNLITNKNLFIINKNDPGELKVFKQEILEKHENHGILNKATLFITELATTDLRKFIELGLNLDFCKSILFQTMYMITVIQYHYPGFRHNDFKIDNILVDIYEPEPDTYFTYKIFGKDYYIRDLGFRLKMWDFDFAASNEVKNIIHYDDFYKEFGNNKDINPVYDIHIFMNNLLSYFRKFIPLPIITFLEKYLPRDIRGNDNIYTMYGRLTNYHQTKDINKTTYIPPYLKSPAEFILSDSDGPSPDNLFINFLESPPDDFTNIQTYDSKIPDNELVRQRKDMFNTMLIKPQVYDDSDDFDDSDD